MARQDTNGHDAVTTCERRLCGKLLDNQDADPRASPPACTARLGETGGVRLRRQPAHPCHGSQDTTGLLIQLVSGAVGGNIGRMLDKARSLGRPSGCGRYAMRASGR